ncbi:MAG: transposase, partial [Chloroflexota bacterium]
GQRLWEIFAEERQMLKESSIAQEWISEGRAEGRAEGARRALLRLLRARFGEMSPAAVGRVEKADADWCEEMIERAAAAETLDE